MRRSARVTLLATILLAVTACSGEFSDPTRAPTAGPLNLVLTTPNTDDGALLLHITGGPIDSITVAGGYTIYDAAESATTHRLIIRGNITGGSVATVWVRDQSAHASYSVMVEQVATRETFQQRPSTGYSATLAIP